MINCSKAIEAFRGEKYVISHKRDQLRVVLHETLEPLDLLRAYFTAYYLKATLFTMVSGNNKDKERKEGELYAREKKEVCEDLRAMDDPLWLERVAAWRKNPSRYLFFLLFLPFSSFIYFFLSFFIFISYSRAFHFSFFSSHLFSFFIFDSFLI